MNFPKFFRDYHKAQRLETPHKYGYIPIEKALPEKGNEKENHNHMEKASTFRNPMEKANTLYTSKPLQAIESEMLVRPRKYAAKPLQESRIRKTL